MEKTKVLANVNYIAIIKFTTLVGVATLAPLFFTQAITGTVVNATLFLAVALLGFRTAIFVAIVPSLIALSIGQLPAILAPMVPFIMAGNIILMYIFSKLKDSNYWFRVGSASFLKFIFLFATSQLLIHFVIKSPVAAKIAMLMSWPQLLTALAGGVLAYVTLGVIKKNLI